MDTFAVGQKQENTGLDFRNTYICTFIQRKRCEQIINLSHEKYNKNSEVNPANSACIKLSKLGKTDGLIFSVSNFCCILWFTKTVHFVTLYMKMLEKSSAFKISEVFCLYSIVKNIINYEKKGLVMLFI